MDAAQGAGDKREKDEDKDEQKKRPERKVSPEKLIGELEHEQSEKDPASKMCRSPQRGGVHSVVPSGVSPKSAQEIFKRYPRPVIKSNTRNSPGDNRRRLSLQNKFLRPEGKGARAEEPESESKHGAKSGKDPRSTPRPAKSSGKSNPNALNKPKYSHLQMMQRKNWTPESNEASARDPQSAHSQDGQGQQSSTSELRSVTSNNPIPMPKQARFEHSAAKVRTIPDNECRKGFRDTSDEEEESARGTVTEDDSMQMSHLSITEQRAVGGLGLTASFGSGLNPSTKQDIGVESAARSEVFHPWQAHTPTHDGTQSVDKCPGQGDEDMDKAQLQRLREQTAEFRRISKSTSARTEGLKLQLPDDLEAIQAEFSSDSTLKESLSRERSVSSPDSRSDEDDSPRLNI